MVVARWGLAGRSWREAYKAVWGGLAVARSVVVGLVVGVMAVAIEWRRGGGVTLL